MVLLVRVVNSGDGEDGIVCEGVDWRGSSCCIFIINSISREDHLSGVGSRPSY